MIDNQPIQHIVLFSFKPDVNEAQKQKLIECFRDLCMQLKGVREFRVGDNISQSALAQDWHFACISILENSQTLADFLAHPAHSLLSQTASPLYEKCVVFDLPMANA